MSLTPLSLGLLPAASYSGRISLFRRLSFNCNLSTAKSSNGQKIVLSSSLGMVGVKTGNSPLEMLKIAASYHQKRLRKPQQLPALYLGAVMTGNSVVKSPLLREGLRIIDPIEKCRIAEVIDPRMLKSLPVVEVPLVGETISKKWAHRMLRIRKRKMKVHRRKRLWKRMWTVWKKKFYGREKKRELHFRRRLTSAVWTAEKFDAKAYVDLYFKDAHHQFTPKTYKGRSKPKFVIEELLERDRKMAERQLLNKTDLVTGAPLVMDGETVDEFIKRKWK